MPPKPIVFIGGLTWTPKPGKATPVPDDRFRTSISRESARNARHGGDGRTSSTEGR